MENRNGSANRASFLSGITPFKHISPAEIKTLAASFKTRVYRHREFILQQEDSSSELFVIRSGKVRVLTLNPSGDESCLRVLSVGDLLGELSAFDGSPRSASAQALGRCTVLVMNREHFLTYLETMPSLAISFINLLTEKLRWTTLYSHTIAQYDTAGRLLHILIHYTDMLGREIAPGKTYEIDLGLNQSDLASMAGAKREWVNRLLRKWRESGLIDYHRGKFTIHDLDALTAERDRRMSVLGDEEW